MKHLHGVVSLLLSTTFLVGCGGGGGSSSSSVATPPPPPPPAPPPAATLTVDVQLAAGDPNCFRGGTRTDSGPDNNGNGVLDAGEVTSSTFSCTVADANTLQNFSPIATFPVCLQQAPDCNSNVFRSVEIVDISEDGNLLVYTDGPRQTLGFVDVTDPSNPGAAGTRDLPGQPVSLAVAGNFAIVAVDGQRGGEQDVGTIEVVNLTTRTIARSFPVVGTPDSVAVSPDGDHAIIGVGNFSVNSTDQSPIPGFLISLDISGADPANWTDTAITLTGLANNSLTDPEPENLDINEDNIAVVSLQNNNYLALVDLEINTIINSFSASLVNLDDVDATEGQTDVILLNQRLTGLTREPDGVAWINIDNFITANEGGSETSGSRSFSVFDTAGSLVFEAGNALDYEAARLGHYPENRSEQRGNETEGAEVGIFDQDRFAFIGSERGDLVFVYDIADPANPILTQSLPTPASPEGIRAVPERHLLLVGGEEENRPDGIRSSIAIYEFDVSELSYPTIRSEDRADGTPIPWGALSGLAEDPVNSSVLYSVEDGEFDANRIFRLDVSGNPASLVEDIRIRDDNNILSSLAISGPDSDRDRFDGNDRDDLTNDDGTANLDLEGISVAGEGGFWVVAEGEGDSDNTLFNAIDAINLLVRTNDTGIIQEAIRLPANIDAIQQDRRFSGVAEYDGTVFATFHSPWGAEINNRIGRYDLSTDQWDFVFYATDTPESQNGGEVNLTDIVSLGGGNFRVIESDSEGGPDAAIRRLYDVNLAGAASNSVASKTLARDLLVTGDLPAGNGAVPNNLSKALQLHWMAENL